MITETELQYIAEEVSRKGRCKELAEALEMTSHLQGDVTAYELLQRWKCQMQQFSIIHIKSHLMHHLRCINQQNTVKRYIILHCAWVIVVMMISSFRLTYGQLQSYAEKFKEIAAEVDNTQKKLTSFKVSAVSKSMLEEISTKLKKHENQLELIQVKLNDLPEIKEDLQKMVLKCKQVKIARITI